MGRNDAVLPKPLIKLTQSTVSRLKRTQDSDATTVFSFFSLALHLLEIQMLREDTSEIFICFINRLDGLSAIQFQQSTKTIFECLRIC